MTDAEFAAAVVGRRFVSDFRVVAIGPGPVAVLHLHGDQFALSLGELRTIIERGLFAEHPEGAIR